MYQDFGSCVHQSTDVIYTQQAVKTENEKYKVNCRVDIDRTAENTPNLRQKESEQDCQRIPSGY